MHNCNGRHQIWKLLCTQWGFQTDGSFRLEKCWMDQRTFPFCFLRIITGQHVSSVLCCLTLCFTLTENESLSEFWPSCYCQGSAQHVLTFWMCHLCSGNCLTNVLWKCKIHFNLLHDFPLVLQTIVKNNHRYGMVHYRSADEAAVALREMKRSAKVFFVAQVGIREVREGPRDKRSERPHRPPPGSCSYRELHRRPILWEPLFPAYRQVMKHLDSHKKEKKNLKVCFFYGWWWMFW